MIEVPSNIRILELGFPKPSLAISIGSSAISRVIYAEGTKSKKNSWTHASSVDSLERLSAKISEKRSEAIHPGRIYFLIGSEFEEFDPKVEEIVEYFKKQSGFIDNYAVAIERKRFVHWTNEQDEYTEEITYSNALVKSGHDDILNAQDRKMFRARIGKFKGFDAYEVLVDRDRAN